MTGLALLFRAECVKLRKNWPLVVAILAPVVQVGFLTVLIWFSEERVLIFRPGARFWLEVNAMAWNLAVMPVAVALIAHLSWSTEGEARAWNHVLIQPTALRNHYLVKLLSHLVLMLAGWAILQLLLPVGAWILGRNARLALLMGPLPWEVYLRFGAYALAALLPLVAFQTWFSMRFPGLWGTLAVMAVGTWFGTQLVDRAAWTGLLPWGLNGAMALALERLTPIPWARVPWGLLGTSALVFLGIAAFREAHGPNLES